MYLTWEYDRFYNFQMMKKVNCSNFENEANNIKHKQSVRPPSLVPQHRNRNNGHQFPHREAYKFLHIQRLRRQAAAEFPIKRQQQLRQCKRYPRAAPMPGESYKNAAP